MRTNGPGLPLSMHMEHGFHVWGSGGEVRHVNVIPRFESNVERDVNALSNALKRVRTRRNVKNFLGRNFESEALYLEPRTAGSGSCTSETARPTERRPDASFLFSLVPPTRWQQARRQPVAAAQQALNRYLSEPARNLLEPVGDRKFVSPQTFRLRRAARWECRTARAAGPTSFRVPRHCHDGPAPAVRASAPGGRCRPVCSRPANGLSHRGSTALWEAHPWGAFYPNGQRPMANG